MGFGNRGSAESDLNRPREGGAYDNRWKSTLRMQPGEALVGRILEGDQYPILYKRHSHAETSNGFNAICTRPQRCLLCDAVAAMDVWYGRNKSNPALRGQKPSDYLKMPSDRAVFPLVSTRVMFRVPDGEKVRSVPRVCNAAGAPCTVVRGAPIQPTSTGKHEYDGVFEFQYEGLTGIDLGNSKKKPQASVIFNAQDTLEMECRCGAKVADGLLQRASRVIRDASGRVTGCEARCQSPGSWSVSDCWVQVIRTGAGMDLDYEMKFYPPTGQIPPEYRGLIYDEAGNQRVLDASHFQGDLSIQVSVLRQLAPSLARFGLNVEALISGGSAQAQAPEVAAGFGGLPQFGGATAPQPPRVAAPAPAFAPPPAAPMPSVQPQGAPFAQSEAASAAVPSAVVGPTPGAPSMPPPPPPVTITR